MPLWGVVVGNLLLPMVTKQCLAYGEVNVMLLCKWETLQSNQVPFSYFL